MDCFHTTLGIFIVWYKIDKIILVVGGEWQSVRVSDPAARVRISGSTTSSKKSVALSYSLLLRSEICPLKSWNPKLVLQENVNFDIVENNFKLQNNLVELDTSFLAHFANFGEWHFYSSIFFIFFIFFQNDTKADK